MTFTPRFQKALRRKRRKDVRPGTQRQQEIERMTKTSQADHELMTYATAVPIKDQIGKYGVWVWKETAPNFKIAGDIHPEDKVREVVLSKAPGAVFISPKEFHERTQHVRHAGEEN